MKKFIILLLVVIFILSTGVSHIYARAGGGSSGSSGGGSSSSSRSSSSSGTRRSRSNPISQIVNLIMFIVISGASAIAFRMRLLKAKINSKRIMNLLDNKDDAWKYKNIQKQVETSYFNIQKAWSNQDMSTAQKYMLKDLYDSFQTKLEWMKIKNQRNILKKISLLEAIPISIYDDQDDTKDSVWYFIKGSMIDYTIDTNTNLIIEGKDVKKQFIEYWKFVRQDKNKWVLAQILQEDEKDKILF